VSVTEDNQDAYWAAVQARDVGAAYDVAAGCLARGARLGEVLEALVSQAQDRVGRLWAADALSVAEEHAATAVSEQVVARLARLVPQPDGALVLVACAEREWHSLPALVVTHTLRDLGLRAEFVGPSASPDHVVARILDTGPRAVLLSASVASSLPRVRRQVEAVRSTGTPVVVGGRGFGGDPQRALALGATAYAARADDVVAILDTLPHHVGPVAPLRGAPAHEAQAITSSRDDVVRAVLASPAVARSLAGQDGSPDHWSTVLSTFVPHVVDCVVGGLLVDDPLLVAAERSWLRDVVTRRGGAAASVDVVWDALADRLRDFPEAVRLLS
jgi:MerR family transcriptional regulator, light-induced transcriptional regulator